MAELHRCEGRAYDPRGFGRPYQCSRNAKVHRDGKWFCTIHDPEYIARKDKERQEKFDKEWEDKRAKWRREKILNAIGKDYDTAFLEKVTDNIRDYLKALKES